MYRDNGLKIMIRIKKTLGHGTAPFLNGFMLFQSNIDLCKLNHSNSFSCSGVLDKECIVPKLTCYQIVGKYTHTLTTMTQRPKVDLHHRNDP